MARVRQASPEMNGKQAVRKEAGHQGPHDDSGGRDGPDLRRPDDAEGELCGRYAGNLGLLRWPLPGGRP